MTDLKILYQNLLKEYILITENTQECIWVLDLKSLTFLFISPSILTLRGITPQDAYNEPVSKIFTQNSYKRFKSLILKKAKKFLVERDNGKNSTNIYEFEQYNSEGEIIDIELSTKFVFNKETNSIDIIGISRNISKRKKIEIKKEIELANKKKTIEKLTSYEKELSRVVTTLTKQNSMLKSIATTDELTGIFNRHYFDEIISVAMERNDRYHEPLTMIFFDIDHFKQVNDTWGHSTGDEVLIKISKTVKSHIRKPDVLIRWGGEEFTILLPQTNIKGGTAVAEKLRVLLENQIHPHAGKVTSSFAVAERYLEESFENWFERLDKALYAAKEKGRNCVITVQNFEFAPISFSKLKWKTTWNSGNPIIDKQRRYIIELANSLLDSAVLELFSAESELKLKALCSHLNYHFTYEEGFLELINYPELKEHKIYHEEIIGKIAAIKEKFYGNEIKTSDLFGFFLEDLILNHFLKQDILYFSYIVKENQT